MKIKCMVKDIKNKDGKEFKALSVSKTYIEHPSKAIAENPTKYFDVRIARKAGALEDRIAPDSKYLDIECKEGDAFVSKKTKYPTIIVLAIDSAKPY